MRIITAIFSLLAVVSAQSPDGFFTNPAASNTDESFADNQVFVVGSIVTLKWNANVAPYNMSLWQQNPKVAAAEQASSPIFSSSDTGQQIFQWVVALGEFDLAFNNIFFFGAGTAKSNVDFTSHYFNISQASSSSSISISTSSSTSASTIPPATSTPTSSATHTSSPTSGLDSGAKIGLGVGLGIGIPIVALLGALVFLLWRRSRKQNLDARASTGAFAPPYSFHEKVSPNGPISSHPVSYQEPIYEAGGNPVTHGWQSPVELDPTPRSG